MKILLCVQLHRCSSAQRQEEIHTCLASHLRHPGLDGLLLWLEEDAAGAASPAQGRSQPSPWLPESLITAGGDSLPIELIRTERRITYADWLRCASGRNDTILLLANNDIRFDHSLDLLAAWLPTPDRALAVSRWETSPPAELPWLRASPHWSQDVWAIRSDAPIDASLLQASAIPLGVPGCDNRIAHVLWSHGFGLSNPCLQIRCLHQHRSEGRSYDRAASRLFGACTYVHPALAPGELSELEHTIWSRQPERSGGICVHSEPAAAREAGGVQIYASEAGRDAGRSEEGFTPFQARRWLLAIGQNGVPIGPDRVLVSADDAGPRPVGPRSADRLLLPLSALRQGGVLLRLPHPRHLEGLMLRLPADRRYEGKLGLHDGTGNDTEDLEVSFSAGPEGNILLLPPGALPGQISWLTLSLAEVAEVAGAALEDGSLLELTLLATPEAPPAPAPRSPARPLAQRIDPVVPAPLDWSGSEIEADARDRHARLGDLPAASQAEWHSYLALPWSGFRQRLGRPERLLEAYRDRLLATRNQLAATGSRLRLHTVHQSGDWQELQDIWQLLGVTDLWLVRGPWEAPPPGSPRLMAWPASGGLIAAEANPAEWDARAVLLHQPEGTSAADDPGADVRSLSHCRFVLCRADHACGAILFWRTLAAGAVPVLVDRRLGLPPEQRLPIGAPWSWDEVILRHPGLEYAELVARCKAIDPLDWRFRQLLGARVFRASQTMTCFGALG